MAIEILHQLKLEKLVWTVTALVLAVLLLTTNSFWICNSTTENKVVDMVIHDFTEPELESFRTLCNFTPLERQVFDKRAQGFTLEAIADELGYSPEYLKRVSQKVNRKIIRVL